MTHIKIQMTMRLIRFYISIIYLISVFFYTFYGVLKSGNEYFCLQGRADTPIFNGVYYPKILNISLFNGNNDKFSAILVSDNKILDLSYSKEGGEKCRNSYNEDVNVYKISKSQSDVFNIDYTLAENYYHIECTISESDPEFKVQHDSNKTCAKLFDNTLGTDDMELAEDGNIKYKKSEIYLNRKLNITKIGKLKCIYQRSTQTCETKIETTNLFFIAYFLTILITIISFALNNLSYNRYFFKRKWVAFYNFFDGRQKVVRFCNPVTGSAVKLNLNDEVYIFDSSQSSFIYSYGLDSFKDLDGSYTFTLEGDVLIIENGKSELLKCSPVEKKIICGYFYEISKNSRVCAVSNSFDHYYKTSEVIRHIVNGGGLKRHAITSEKYVLDVKEFEFNLIKDLFEVKEDFILSAIEHNWRFFKNGYNLKALINCMSKKTWSRQIPAGVKNSQWKIYTSDFKQLADSFNYINHKCQKVYKPTAVLRDIFELRGKIKKEAPISSEKVIINELDILKNLDSSDKCGGFSIVERLKPWSGSAAPSKRTFTIESGKNDPTIVKYMEEATKLVDEISDDYNNLKESRGNSNIAKLSKLKGEDKELTLLNYGMEYLEKFPKTINSYKDVLLKPPLHFPNKTKNRISRLEKKYSKTKNPVELEKIDEEIKSLKPEVIPEYTEVINHLKKGKVMKNFFLEHLIVEEYHKILPILDEYDKKREKSMIGCNSEFSVKDLFDTSFKRKNTPAKKKISKKSKNKGNKGKTGQQTIRKRNLGFVYKDRFFSRDFDSNFKCALKNLGFKHKDGTEIKVNMSLIRKRTLYCTQNLITDTFFKNNFHNKRGLVIQEKTGLIMRIKKESIDYSEFLNKEDLVENFCNKYNIDRKIFNILS